MELSDYDRSKIDQEDDLIFYSTPKLVHHLDNSFRERLTNLYREELNKDYIVLDLMSSWVSHLPDEVRYKRVIIHGLNKVELQKNKRADQSWIQDLNKDFNIPLADKTIDATLIVAGWQYLQYPELITKELTRIVKDKGKIIVSFTNRAFWHKSPNIWTYSSDFARLNYVCSILEDNGWSIKEKISVDSVTKGLKKIFSISNDPFLSVIATNNNFK